MANHFGKVYKTTRYAGSLVGIPPREAKLVAYRPHCCRQIRVDGLPSLFPRLQRLSTKINCKPMMLGLRHLAFLSSVNAYRSDNAVDIRCIGLACRSNADRSKISPAQSVGFKISPSLYLSFLDSTAEGSVSNI